MEITLQNIAGLIAAGLGLYASLIYIFSIFGKGLQFAPLRLYSLAERTKPSRVTWLIWTFVGTITVSSYYASGATDTLWVPIILTIEYFCTAILSLFYGEGGTWRGDTKQMRRDIVCLVGAAMSGLAWWWFDVPQIALITTILIDAFGAWPTIVKAYMRPLTENRRAWTFTFLSSVANIFAVEWRWEIGTLFIAIYPLYMFIANGLIATFLYRRFSPSPRA